MGLSTFFLIENTAVIEKNGIQFPYQYSFFFVCVLLLFIRLMDLKSN